MDDMYKYLDALSNQDTPEEIACYVQSLIHETLLTADMADIIRRCAWQRQDEKENEI